jgi:hypothetical protein
MEGNQRQRTLSPIIFIRKVNQPINLNYSAFREISRRTPLLKSVGK